MAAHAPAMAGIDVLMNMGLIEVDQVLAIPLSTVEQWPYLVNKRFPPFRVGPAQQLLGFLPRQFQPMQRSPDGLAAAAAAKLCVHKANQALQRPARLRISPRYGRRSGDLLGRAYHCIKGRRYLRAKGGRPPVRRYNSASGPCSL